MNLSPGFAKDLTPTPRPPLDSSGRTLAATEATGLPDTPAAGAWDEARGTAIREPVARPPVVRGSWWRRVAVVLGTIAALLLIAAVIIPNLLQSHMSHTPGMATVDNLKALATAQAQYIKKYDCYADAAWRLHAANTLIADDLNRAFEDSDGNGDSLKPQPKAGYIFRFLHTDWQHIPRAFYNDPADPDKGQSTWAITARAANPGVSGEYQYYITEEGVVYKHVEPPPGDPHHGQFLLDEVPAPVAAGWRTAK